VPLSRLLHEVALLEPDQALILGSHQVCASLTALHFSFIPCTILDRLQMSHCTAHAADWQFLAMNTCQLYIKKAMPTPPSES